MWVNQIRFQLPTELKMLPAMIIQKSTSVEIRVSIVRNLKIIVAGRVSWECGNFYPIFLQDRKLRKLNIKVFGIEK